MNYFRYLSLFSVFLCNTITTEAAKNSTSYYCLSKSRVDDFLMSFDFNLTEQLKIHHENNSFQTLEKALSGAFERAKTHHQFAISKMPYKKYFVDQLIDCFGPSEEITRNVKKFINEKIRETNENHNIEEYTKLSSNWIEANTNTTLNFVCKCIKNFLKNHQGSFDVPDCLFIFTALASKTKSLVFFCSYVPSLHFKKARLLNTNQRLIDNQQQQPNNSLEDIPQDAEAIMSCMVLFGVMLLGGSTLLFIVFS